MKKLISTLSMFAVLTLSTTLLAGSGSAVIPHYFSRYVSSTHYSTAAINISNTTDEAVTVELTLYNDTGSILSDDGSMTAGNITGNDVTNYDDDVTGYTATFDIAANSTGTIVVKTLNTYTTGYGIIEWVQSGSKKRTKALVSVVKCETYNDSADILGSYTVSVNNGLPF